MAKLYFRYGAMNSGKSTALLQVAHNYEEREMEIFIIKPAIDTKGNKSVSSRLGTVREADFIIPSEPVVNNYLGSILREIVYCGGISCVLVDEAQFLKPYEVDELYRFTKKSNVPVICYGLRCDFQMMGFPGATRLLELADSIEELKTICKCGKKATHNMRLINGKPAFVGEQICIDNQEHVSYQAVCGKCYLEIKGEKYEKNYFRT